MFSRVLRQNSFESYLGRTDPVLFRKWSEFLRGQTFGRGRSVLAPTAPSGTCVTEQEGCHQAQSSHEGLPGKVKAWAGPWKEKVSLCPARMESTERETYLEAQ